MLSWKGKANEKQHVIVLQLSKACKIGAIDIGNAGSAFAEVLVGNSCSSPDQKYEVW